MSRFQFIFFIFIIAAIPGAQGWAQHPLPGKILLTLKPTHPRLLVKSLQEFEDIKIRSNTDGFLKLSIAAVLRSADSILLEPVVTYSFLDAFRLDTRKINAHVLALAMAYRLTGDNKYAVRLWMDLDAVSKFPDWNPRHFLDCALVTQPIAIAYDWLYDVWTPEQRRVLKQQIISKGLLEGLLYYDKLFNNKQFDWSAIEHNWNLVCNGNMAFGALAIADEEPVIAERILTEALTRLPKSIKHFGPDGAWDEGPGYWSFAMRATVPILSSLVTSLGTDFGLSDITGFSKAGQFFVGLGGANNTSFNYADASPGITRSPELFWLANRFNQPKLGELQKAYSLQQMQIAGTRQSPLELLWYRHESNGNLPAFPLDNYFRGVEVATLRSSWESDSWFVGFKAGDNNANHGHLDIGSYVLDYSGIRWITDLGHENYNVPGYFGDLNTVSGGKRWSYYRTRAEGHNTLVVNPGKMEDQDVNAKTKMKRFETKPGISFGIMDITEAYKEKVQSAERGIALLNNKSVLVQDELSAENKMEIYWFSHTQAAITISTNGKKAFFVKDGKKIIAHLLSPANAIFQIMEAVPLPSSPNPEQNNKNTGIKKISVYIQGVNKVTIAVEFSESEKKPKTKLSPLKNW